MTKPLFASKWYRDAPAAELRQEIQNLYRIIGQLTGDVEEEVTAREAADTELQEDVAALESAVREGVFTPVVKGSTGDPSVTYTTQAGRYLRLGSLVFVSIRVTISSISGGSGALQIGGLPWKVVDSLEDRTPFQVVINNFPFGSGRTQMWGTGTRNADTIGVITAGSSVPFAAPSLANLSNGSDIWASGFYWTSDT